MLIRKTRAEELERVMEVYAHARAFMAEQGNPHQWGDISWPPRDLIEQDIAAGKSYVCEHDGQIAAVFYYDFGDRVDPCYDVIEGAWSCDGPYGVVHRIASAHIVRGAGRACIEWALEKSGYLRIDTHEANVPMRGMLEGMGFGYCGIIYVREDTEPRLAFDRRL